MKLTKEQANDIRRDSSDEFQVIDEGDWIDNGKYSYRDVVFLKDNKFYQMTVSRSGSYFTDYDYDCDLECPEVCKVTKTIEVWESVK